MENNVKANNGISQLQFHPHVEQQTSNPIAKPNVMYKLESPPAFFKQSPNIGTTNNLVVNRNNNGHTHTHVNNVNANNNNGGGNGNVVSWKNSKNVSGEKKLRETIN
jgi:hypothetical protein